jgi:hypothetical protein
MVLLKIDSGVKRTKPAPSVIVFTTVGVVAGVALLWFYGSHIAGFATSASGNLSHVLLRWDFLLFLLLASFHLAANIEVISLGGDKIPPAITDAEDSDFFNSRILTKLLPLLLIQAKAMFATSGSTIVARLAGTRRDLNDERQSDRNYHEFRYLRGAGHQTRGL